MVLIGLALVCWLPVADRLERRQPFAFAAAFLAAGLLIVRLACRHRYQLTPLSRRVAVLFTRGYVRVLAPGSAESDPRLPTDFAHRGELARAWRQLDQRLNRFTNAAFHRSLTGDPV